MRLVLFFFLQLAGTVSLAQERLVNGRITATGKGLPVAQATIRVPGSAHGTVCKPGPCGSVHTQFFRKNPTPSIFGALQLGNGVPPQLNCKVCNTGDIHINDPEGLYTMLLIDGIPIFSSLASVYGLQGITNALVEKVEIVKGPASSLYGSEAIGGLVNIITRQPQKAPVLSLEYTVSSWREHHLDAGLLVKTGPKSNSLMGINYFLKG